jgi:YVTN family beta-propeller protein
MKLKKAQRMMQNRQSWRIASLLALVLALALLAPTARADGGAPNLAYVSGASGGVAIIDLAGQKVTGTIRLDGDPRGMALSSDFRFLYVALAGKNGVAVVDAQAKQQINTIPTGPGPTALVLDLVDPSHLWVANTGGNTVTVVNPNSGQKVATIPVGLHPTSITIAGPSSGISETDGSSEVLVANHDAGSVTVINSESFKVLATVPLPNGENPIGVTAPSMGGTAYVSTEQGHIYGLTMASHQIFGPVFSGQQFHFMDYDATTGAIYVPDSRANVLNVLRPADSGLRPPATLPKEPIRVLPFAGAPWSVAVTNDGSLGLIAQRDSGTVTMLDVRAVKTLATIHVGGTPQFVLAGAYPPLVSRQGAQVLLIVAYIVAGVLLLGGIGWLAWWMRRQERRIRELHAQEDAEYERQLLAGEALKEADAQSAAPLQHDGARETTRQQHKRQPGGRRKPKP